MGVSRDQNIAVQLALHGSESLHVAPWDNLVTMNDSNLEVVDLHDLRLRQALDIVAVALHDVCLTFCGSQVLKPFDGLDNQDKLV